jgi:hypothetical protein
MDKQMIKLPEVPSFNIVLMGKIAPPLFPGLSAFWHPPIYVSKSKVFQSAYP